MLLAFPPPPSLSSQAFAVVGLAVIACIVLWGIWSRGRGKPRAYDPLLWPAIALCAVVAARVAAASDVFRPYLFPYAASLNLLAAAIGFSSLWRLVRQKLLISPMLTALAGFTIWCCSLAAFDTGIALDVAQGTQCKSHLKTVSLALKTWVENYDRFPGSDVSESGQPPLSWRVALLPFLEQAALRSEYEDGRLWNDHANLPIARARVAPLICPAMPQTGGIANPIFTSYALVTGPGTIIPDGRGLRSDEITDGPSQTILLAEVCGMKIIWTEPRDVDISQAPLGVNLPGDTPETSAGLLSSYHGVGTSGLSPVPVYANVALADGSVRTIVQGIDPKILKSMTTATGSDGDRAEDAFEFDRQHRTPR